MTAASSPRGLHVFLGPDRARKLQRLQEWERALGAGPLDRHDLDAASAAADEVVALARQRPAAAAARLIVIDRAHALGADAVAGLLRHAASVAETACVVCLVEVELGARHALAAAQRDGALTIERFPGRETAAAKPFALADALANADAGEALRALRDQLDAGRDALEVFGLVSWQLQRWVLFKRLARAGPGAEALAALTGLKPWQAERLRTEVARRSLGQWQRLLAFCWEMEAAAKTGRTPPVLAVERLILEACRLPAAPARGARPSGGFRAAGEPAGEPGLRAGSGVAVDDAP
jgi:DNA polymerase III delta subunit